MTKKDLKSVFAIVFVFFLSGFNLPGAIGCMHASVNSSTHHAAVLSDTIPLKINYEMLKMFEIYKGKENLSDSIRFQLLHDKAIRTTDLWTRTYLMYLLSLMEKSGLSAGTAVDTFTVYQEPVDESKPQRAEEPTKPSRRGDAKTATPTKPVRTPAQEFIQSGLETTIKPASSGVVSYHVQIAASRSALSPEALREIYSGKEEIVNYQEDGWEKYYIGNFDSFRKAMILLRQTPVEGAFPIAFVMGSKTSILKAQEAGRNQSLGALKTFTDIQEPVYRIQIAASRTPLSAEQLSSLYPRIDEIGVILEDNWYKYSLEGGQTLEEALQLLKQLQIKRAFPVRYQKGMKIPLK